MGPSFRWEAIDGIQQGEAFSFVKKCWLKSDALRLLETRSVESFLLVQAWII